LLKTLQDPQARGTRGSTKISSKDPSRQAWEHTKADAAVAAAVEDTTATVVKDPLEAKDVAVVAIQPAPLLQAKRKH